MESDSAPLIATLPAMKTSEGLCDMCGHFVAVRQKAHIFDGRNDIPDNLLLLCPSCHIRLDTHLKPKLFKALGSCGCKLPEEWQTSIYDRAARRSAAVLRKRRRMR
jgi:hypothetical protein